MEEIADGVFVHQGEHEDVGEHIANIGFVVGDDAVAVIDTGGSREAGERLRASVRAVTDHPIRYVINTHMHPDHVLGNVAFEGGDPEFIGHERLPGDLEVRADDYRAIAGRYLDKDVPEGWLVLPERTVSGTERLDLGGRHLELEAHPTAHTSNDLTVLDERTGTWWLGDLLFVDRIPALDGSVTGWIDVLDDLIARDVERAVPGHGPGSVSWPEAAEPQMEYLEALRDDVREVLDAGGGLRAAYEQVAVEHSDRWALFELYHERNVGSAFSELEWE